MTNPTFLANHFESCISLTIGGRLVSEKASRRTLFGTLAALFVACTAVTTTWCNSMSAAGEMPMPGGWTMSMAWMRMPGQTWAGATVSFVSMWVVMMAAMMLPSLAPVLWRYHLSLRTIRDASRGRLTTLVGLGYFFAWTLFGLAVFPVGAAMATIEMERPELARTVPIAARLVVLIAGSLQFTKWKAHHLTSCREAPGRDFVPSAGLGAAWRLGLHFGLHCGLSCANLTAVLLLAGVMDLRAMAAIMAAITAERLAPAGDRVARATGLIVVGAGLILIARAARFHWCIFCW
jgi:predicted metal-binding membrane protein